LKLEEMKKIAEARTSGILETNECNVENCWCVLVSVKGGGPDDLVCASGCIPKRDGEFLVMAANNWDKLMKVVEAAKRLSEIQLLSQLTSSLYKEILEADIFEPQAKLVRALKELECDHEWKDKGSWFKCTNCGDTRENISGVFEHAKNYGLTPSQLHAFYKDEEEKK
jgi:hypothetical protein